MLKFIAVVLLALPVVSAQIVPLPNISFFPPELKAYFELTDDQITAITKANSDLDVFRTGKLQRQIQVQVELAQETAKQTPDPMALGLRYVELEAIRRELQAEQQKTVAAVQNILTAPQKAKLAALQQALQLYSTACSAVSQNVLQPPALLNFISGRNTIPGSILPVLSLSPTCGGTIGQIRTGDFTPTLK